MNPATSSTRNAACRTVALSIVLATATCSFASAADAPVVGPSAPVTATVPDERAQRNPTVAFDGKGTYLVAWQQGAKYFERPDAAVLAARVSSDGKPMDAKPISFGSVAGTQEAPKVAFSNGIFLVVWQDFRNGKDWDVYGARVKPDGTLMDAQPLAIAAGPHNQALPSVAPAPDGFLVVWQDRRGGGFYEIYAASVSTSGKVAPSGGHPVKLRGKNLRGGEVRVVRAGQGWFMTWKDESQWSHGPKGTTTRFVGRISGTNGPVNMASTDRMPRGLYGHFAVDLAGGTKSALMVTGGSQRSTRCAMGAVFDAKTGEPLGNPNPGDKSVRGGSGWNTKTAIVLLEPLVPGYVSPMGVGANDDKFLVVVRQGHKGKGKEVRPLRLLRIDASGRKLDDSKNLPVLDDGNTPCANPAVAGGPNGTWLVAYQSSGGTGKGRILIRLIHAK